jgi:hypothetical protein
VGEGSAVVLEPGEKQVPHFVRNDTGGVFETRSIGRLFLFLKKRGGMLQFVGLKGLGG